MKLFNIYEEFDKQQYDLLFRMVARILEFTLRDSLEDMHAGDGEFSEDDMKDFNLTIRNPIYSYVVDVWGDHTKKFNKKDFYFFIMNILKDFLERVKDKKTFVRCIKEGVNKAFTYIKDIKKNKNNPDHFKYMGRYFVDQYEPAEYIKL